jgi:hypothetical protein
MAEHVGWSGRPPPILGRLIVLQRYADAGKIPYKLYGAALRQPEERAVAGRHDRQRPGRRNSRQALQKPRSRRSGGFSKPTVN